MPNGQLGFDWQDDAAEPAVEPPALAATLGPRLGDLANQRVYLGTSSWKYPGWLDQVYTPKRYQARGRFAQRRFERDCLGEYATVFPTVCGDFVFYQFPTAATWEHTFSRLPEGFRFAMKIPEEITAERFANRPRYGRRAGTSNAEFMNAGLLCDKLLAKLEPYRDRLGPLIFQFGTIHTGSLSDPDRFAERLDDMLAALPTERYRFAAEVRNPSFVAANSPYFACLRRNNVAHCLSSWTRMPSIREQTRTAGALTSNTVTARFLLRPGNDYKDAVRDFAPYERVQSPYPDGRYALRELIERCLSEQRTLFAYVNNRLEGNAPQTIDEATRP